MRLRRIIGGISLLGIIGGIGLASIPEIKIRLKDYFNPYQNNAAVVEYNEMEKQRDLLLDDADKLRIESQISSIQQIPKLLNNNIASDIASESKIRGLQIPQGLDPAKIENFQIYRLIHNQEALMS